MDPGRARELLTRERERIEGELRALRADRGDGELAGVDQHNADAGSDLFENERDQSVIERLERELEAIARAEQRVKDGTYGISVESGEPIRTAVWRQFRGPSGLRTSRAASSRASPKKTPGPGPRLTRQSILLACATSSTAESLCRHGTGSGGTNGGLLAAGANRRRATWLSRRSASLSARARQLTP